MSEGAVDLFRFAGKTVIVTGGNGGIGQGIVNAFSERDANVVIADHAAAVRPLESRGAGRVIDVRTDITKRASVDAMVRQAVEAFGRIDVLINNAGGGKGLAPILEVTPEEIEWMIDLNIRGTLNCTQAAVELMKPQQAGSIVNISSGAALSGAAGRLDPVYAGCKGFINSLTKSLAAGLGEYNIRVNTIAPGWIVPEHDEDISTGSFWVTLRERFGTPETFEAHNRSATPLRRLGRPLDIANAAIYFASDAARHATGQILSICGGAHMPS